MVIIDYYMYSCNRYAKYRMTILEEVAIDDVLEMVPAYAFNLWCEMH